MPKKILETDNLLEKRKFLENIGSNFSLGLAQRASNTSTPLGARNAPNGNLGGRPTATTSRGGSLSSQQGCGVRAEEKTATELKNAVRRKTDSLSFDFEFKNFWKTIAQENKPEFLEANALSYLAGQNHSSSNRYS